MARSSSMSSRCQRLAYVCALCSQWLISFPLNFLSPNKIRNYQNESFPNEFPCSNFSRYKSSPCFQSTGLIQIRRNHFDHFFNSTHLQWKQESSFFDQNRFFVYVFFCFPPPSSVSSSFLMMRTICTMIRFSPLNEFCAKQLLLFLRASGVNTPWLQVWETKIHQENKRWSYVFLIILSAAQSICIIFWDNFNWHIF